jgi:hypothetical protein
MVVIFFPCVHVNHTPSICTANKTVDRIARDGELSFSFFLFVGVMRYECSHLHGLLALCASAQISSVTACNRRKKRKRKSTPMHFIRDAS